MKSKLLSIVFLFTLLINVSASGPKNHIRKARRYRNSNRFEKSEKEYLKALDLDSENFDAQFELGLLYDAAFFSKTKALNAYEKAEKMMPADTVFELYFQLAQTYHYFEEYDKALEYYAVFEKSIIDNKEGLLFTEVSTDLKDRVDFAKRYKEHLFDGQVRNLGKNVNSGFAEYVPVFVERDSTMLYTRRGTDNLGDYYWDNQFYEDMYYTQFSEGEYSESRSVKRRGDFVNELGNTKMHESVVDINSTDDTLIVYRKNTLWYSVYDKGKWNEPVDFGDNINIASYQRHGTFNKEGNILFFSSNSQDGKGGYDLYSSKKQPDGSWGIATNLGDVINTSGDEDSPFWDAKTQRLYFSSKGHLGMGGYDVFYSELSNGTWSKPKNLGSPINSPAHDIYFKVSNDGKEILISSDRKDGYGNMDIYAFDPYGIPEFKDCESWRNQTYSVSIDANPSVDGVGVPIIYEWDFDDGDFSYGRSVNHIYKRPGSYELKLNVYDSLTQRKIEDEELITLEGEVPIILGEDNIHIEGIGPDTVKLGSKHMYNAGVSQVPADSITDYFWKYNDALIEDSILELSFVELGEVEMLLEVLSRNENGVESHYCVTQKVIVVSEEEFVAIEQESNGDGGFPDVDSGSETTLDIGSNLNEQDMEAVAQGKYKLENIYFSFDKYNLRSDAKETLENNIKVLKSNPKLVIKVVGHTDSKGSNSYNIKLSEKRAITAVDYLVKSGIDLDRISATLYEGETDPAAPNTNADGTDNPKNRQLNRRVEFYIVGKLK